MRKNKSSKVLTIILLAGALVAGLVVTAFALRIDL